MSMQDQLAAALAEVNGKAKTNFKIEKVDGRGPRPRKNGEDPVSGGDVSDDEDGDENDEPGQELERTNERGIQKSLAAAIIGVGPASITSWVRLGRIALTTDGFVPIREVRRMTVETALRKNGKAATADGDPTNPDVLAKNRLESAKADMAEIALETKRGSLVSRTAARRAFEEAAVVTKQRVLAIVDTIVADLTGKKDPNVIGTIIRGHLTKTLITLSKGIRLSDEVAVSKEQADGES